MPNNIIRFEEIDLQPTNLYVLTGKHMGKQVFLAYDQHSGGYPWFPDTIYNAEKFSSIEKALKATKDSIAKKELTDVKIAEIMLREVGDSEIDPNYAKAQDIIKSSSPEVIRALKEALK